MKNLWLCASLALLLGACAKDDASQPSTQTAPAVAMGNGKANTWVNLDAQGNPTAIGFTLSKGALDQLPATLPGTDFMLALPDAATQKTPFRHVMINWNPLGHEPAGIYDVPHFDFHFYMMPMAEVMQIPPYAVNPTGFDKVPAVAYLPAGYVRNPGGVPAMGAHWSDVSSPELHGQPFTETFVYGTYNGHVTFWEPMVALSYLRTNPTLEQDIKQPTQYETPGYYPTHFSILAKPDGSYDVSLSNFVKR